jgi:hypothetical protein
MKKWPYLFFPGIFILLLYFDFASTGIYDTGDGVMHYMIAHYSFSHPELFLDHWGKPLYTLLSSPFAYFGYKGSMVFNAMCLTASSWFAWKTAGRLKIPFAFLVAPLCIFAPIALPVSLSGLTEPLFALVLISGVYFTVQGKPGIAAIIISFLPFARTEGFFLAVLFGIYFLLRREFWAAAFLPLGTILYSFIGYFHYHDLLWVIHENPYKGAEEIYGHGNFWHFVSLNEFIWGWALTGLLVCGFLFYLFAHQLKISISKAESFLILGTFLVFLLLHSVFWWKGLFGSLGLHRVMAATIPLAVLIGLRGLQLIFTLVENNAVRITIMILIVASQIFNTVNQHPLPLRPGKEQNIVSSCVEWLQANNKISSKINSAYPYVAMACNKDLFDHSQWDNMWAISNRASFKKGELIVWDSHFDSFDISLPLEKFENDSRFKEVARFGELPLNKSEQNQKFGLVIFETN